MIEFIAQWGYLGLLVTSFIAGSVVPLSSEAIIVACVGPLHLDPWWCLIAATIGNVTGGMTCYWMGTLGNEQCLISIVKVGDTYRGVLQLINLVTFKHV